MVSSAREGKVDREGGTDDDGVRLEGTTHFAASGMFGILCRALFAIPWTNTRIAPTRRPTNKKRNIDEDRDHRSAGTNEEGGGGVGGVWRKSHEEEDGDALRSCLSWCRLFNRRRSSRNFLFLSFLLIGGNYMGI